MSNLELESGEESSEKKYQVNEFEKWDELKNIDKGQVLFNKNLYLHFLIKKI